MLVITRKIGSKIFIADSIVVTVVDIYRGKIRLGIEAPRDISVARDDLLTPETMARYTSNARRPVKAQTEAQS